MRSPKIEGQRKNRRGGGRNDLPAPSDRPERLKNEVRTVFCLTTTIAAAMAAIASATARDCGRDQPRRQPATLRELHSGGAPLRTATAL